MKRSLFAVLLLAAAAIAPRPAAALINGNTINPATQITFSSGTVKNNLAVGGASANNKITLNSASGFTQLILQRGGTSKWSLNNNVSGTDFLNVQNESLGVSAIALDFTNNNIGIGTTAPASKISVGGAGTVLGLIAQPLIVATGIGDQSIAIQGGAAGAVENIMRSVLTQGQFGTSTNHQISIIQNGSPFIVIEPGGNVGIGGITDPAATLDVDGNAQFGSGATKSTFTAEGYYQPLSKTRAEIDLLVPTRAGQYIDCTDCTLPGLCRSTGTLAAQWRKVESATLGCGTNN